MFAVRAHVRLFFFPSNVLQQLLAGFLARFGSKEKKANLNQGLAPLQSARTRRRIRVLKYLMTRNNPVHQGVSDVNQVPLRWRKGRSEKTAEKQRKEKTAEKQRKEKTAEKKERKRREKAELKRKKKKKKKPREKLIKE